jgi:Fibronectin type III domain
MCHICGKPNHIYCNCGQPKFTYDPCPPGGCDPKVDASCVFYNLNNPYGQNNLLNLNLPNGVNLKIILDQIDKLLGNASGASPSGSPSTSPSQDVFVKVDSFDGSAGYLSNKLTAGNNVSFVVLNPDGNESIQINSANDKVSVDAADTPDYLINQISGSTDGIITINVFDQSGVVGLQPCIDVEALLKSILNIPNYQNLFCQLVAACVAQVIPCNPPSNLTASIIAGTASIAWTPGDVTGSQTIEYKLHTSPSFIFFGSVAPTVTTASIPGLSANVTYDFRITDVCASGSTSTSIQQTGIQISCPTVSVTPSQNSVLVSFPPLGGDITQYRVLLLNSVGNSTIASRSLGGPFSNPITVTFDNLTPGTSYNIQVQPGNGTTNNTSCAFVPFTTTALATCSGPSNLVLTPVSKGMLINWNGDPSSQQYNLYYGVQANITGTPPGNGWIAYPGNPIPASQTNAVISGLSDGVTYSFAINSTCLNGTTTSYLTGSATVPATINAAISLINFSRDGSGHQILSQVNIIFSEPTPVPLTLYLGTTISSTITGTKYAIGWDIFAIPAGYIAQPPYHDVSSNIPYIVNIPAGITNFTTNATPVLQNDPTSIWVNDVPLIGYVNSTGFPAQAPTLTGLWVKIATPSTYVANFTLTTPSAPITNVNS